jgi:hypothetical protein
MNKTQFKAKTIISFLGIVISITFLQGLDWYYDTSKRIEALGIDFAGLLTDRQTDIEIRNPAYLDGYRAATIHHKGYYSRWLMPLNFSLFYNKCGIAFRYGGEYQVTKEEPKNQSYRLNLTGYWASSGLGLQYDYFIEDKTIEQVNATMEKTKLSEGITFHILSFGYKPAALSRFDVRCRLALGTYDSVYSQFIGGQLTPVAQADFLIPSAQLGLTYEQPIKANCSLCMLIDFGGPTSAYELKTLPVPFQNTVKRNAQGKPSQFDYFANSLFTRVGGAISFLPNPSFLIALGVNDFWGGLKTKQENPITFWYNILALPLAIEWRPNKNVAIRGGTTIDYYYDYFRLKQFQSDETRIYSNWSQYQSFGLGFQLYPGWYLDLTNNYNLFQLENISLSLRKEWR